MAQVIILGSSNAVSSPEHENTHLAILTASRQILVDCGANPIQRLQQADLNPTLLTDVILTHFHPDHVGSFPLLLMDMWLMGRTAPLTVYGLSYTLERIEKVLDVYGWKTWPRFFPVQFSLIAPVEDTPVLHFPEVKISAYPVKHFLPNIGLRVEFVPENKIFAYSCDTAPCPALPRLAREADVLLHEASGATEGHTSAPQAGEIASQAKAKSLYLIHYPTGRFANPAQDLQSEARQTYGGPVILTQDLLKIDF